MLTKPIPAWILFGSLALSGVAGCINAIGFMGVHHQALSHMSGTATIFSTDLASEHYANALHAALVVGSFFVGCVSCGILIPQRTLQAGRHYGVALICESVLLLGATWFFRSESNLGDYLAALACGLQNAMVTTYSGAVIRTTHITGIVTDLGLAVGLAFRGEKVDRRRIGLFLILVSGFVLGGVIGGLGYRQIGFDMLLAPALVTGLAGVSYALYSRPTPRRSS